MNAKTEKNIERTLNVIIKALNAQDDNILTTIKQCLEHMHDIGVCTGRTELYQELYEQERNKNNKKRSSAN